MPKALIMLPDIEQTVCRPSIYQVVKQVFEITHIPVDTEILYAGKRGTVQVTNSEMGSDNRESRFSTSNSVFVTVNENYNTDAVQEIQPMAYDHKPVFADPTTSVIITPIYTTSDVEIEITYRHSSETELRKWLAEMLIKTGQGRDIHLHEIHYTFPIPYEFLIILEDIHKLREQVEPYGESFTEYFEKWRTRRIEILSNQAGEKRHLVIKETQIQIIGRFDFTVMPEKPEFLKDIGLWEGKIVYKYSYQRPDAMFIHYPMTVHNQFLPEKYLTGPENIIDYQRSTATNSKSYEFLQFFSDDRYAEMIRPEDRYIRIPIDDDYELGEPRRFTATILRCLCFLDDDRQNLIDLKNLGDWAIDEDILDYLKGEHRYLHKPFMSIFNVALYKNGHLQDHTKIEVTEDLIVRATEKLSKRDRYHVRLSAMPEIDKPLYQALIRLRAHPKAFFKVLKALNELLHLDPDFNDWEKKGELKEWMFTSVWRILNIFHQGNFMSPNTNIDAYVAEHFATERNNLHLLTKLPPEKIIKVLRNKSARRFTVMNAYAVIKPINHMT